MNARPKIIGGYSLIDSMLSSNSGACFVVLDPWDQREAKGMNVKDILGRIYYRLAQIDEAICFTKHAPELQGLGAAGGFELQLQDRAGAGIVLLQNIGDDLVYQGNVNPNLTRMNNGLRSTVPQLFLEIDRVKAKNLNVPLQSIFNTLQANLGSLYVNDFNLFGRTFRVMMQADHKFREKIDDITRLQVRNSQGQMVPLETLVKVTDTAGPQAITRYNLYPSAKISGAPIEGISTSQAIETVETLASQVLPSSMGYEWTGVTFQQIKAGNMAPIIFGLAFIFVYLFLAAQYESWSIPLAIILSVPLALLGAIMFTWIRKFDNNIYTQIGFVLLIGLCAKTAILIVEFAKQLREQGKPILEAATEAARLRFRPLLMTAVSFILGVVPLVIATGAGAVSRKSLGTAVFGGMLFSTILGVLLIPVFYVVIQRTSEKLTGKNKQTSLNKVNESEKRN